MHKCGRGEHQIKEHFRANQKMVSELEYEIRRQKVKSVGEENQGNKGIFFE